MVGNTGIFRSSGIRGRGRWGGGGMYWLGGRREAMRGMEWGGDEVGRMRVTIFSGSASSLLSQRCVRQGW